MNTIVIRIFSNGKNAMFIHSYFCKCLQLCCNCTWQILFLQLQLPLLHCVVHSIVSLHLCKEYVTAVKFKATVLLLIK